MASVFKQKGRRRDHACLLRGSLARVNHGSLMDRAWMGIHSRIREPDLGMGLYRPFVPSPWDAPWSHPGAASYFAALRRPWLVALRFAPGWLFGDDDRPLKVGGRA